MAGSAKFRVQHLAERPRGWKVRSKRTGDHVLRIAFPPGRRERGAGKVLEVLHPKQNPSCEEGSCRESNPAELVIFTNPTAQDKPHKCPHCPEKFSAAQVEAGEYRKHLAGHRAERAKNPRRRRRGNNHKPGCSCPICKNMRGVRKILRRMPKPVRAVFDRNPDAWESIRAGSRVTFLDRFGQRRTGRAVMRGPFGWVLNMGGRYGTPQVVSRDMVVKVRAGNPLSEKDKAAVKKGSQILETQGYEAFLDHLRKSLTRAQEKTAARRARRNPEETEQAVRLFEIFHGKDAREIVEKHVSAAMRKDYTALGKLLAIGTDDCGYSERDLPQKWDKCPRIEFGEDHVTLASSPDGRQLYAIGGNQNLNGCLEKFQGIDPSKDFIDLGEIAFVVYEARKVHSNFEPTEWVHKFGGKGSVRPAWMYDRLKKQIFFIGGEYFIDLKAEISPGIEG